MEKNLRVKSGNTQRAALTHKNWAETDGDGARTHRNAAQWHTEGCAKTQTIGLNTQRQSAHTRKCGAMSCANTRKTSGNTQRRSAHTQKCGARTQKRGAKTRRKDRERCSKRESHKTQTSDTAQAQRMDHNAQTPRKHREWTKALDDATTALERKRNQKFECPGFTPTANYRGPGRLGARADVAGRNPRKPPPPTRPSDSRHPPTNAY